MSREISSIISIREEEELDKILELIKKKQKNNIVYLHCISRISLGKIIINGKFPMMIDCTYKGLKVIIDQKGPITEEMLEEKLEESNIEYNVVSFQNKSYIEQNLNEKKILFARGIPNLENMVNKLSENCIYYPNIVGKYEMGFINRNGEIEVLEQKPIRGVVEFANQYILIQYYPEEEKNLTKKTIFKLLIKANKNISINYGKNYILNLKEKQKIKKIGETDEI